MGVAGLWDVLRPAGKVRSLTHLAVTEGFELNPDGKRGFRIGIDASIWFFHAAYGKEGENPELRTLFFRCCRLMTTPFLPLFVFDGPKRPSVKRGKRVSGNSHWLTTGMKNIIEAFGFEWRTAPGEAEAELAYLNRIGVIDAVLSDDVDNFLFGAMMVIRNPSNTLSGNRANPVKNSDGRDDGNHVVVYKAADLTSHPDIELTRGGVILIGLLSGGDYHQAGVTGCGRLIAAGLARCGFGDTLLKASQELSRDELPGFLSTWRDDIRQELRTNSKGLIGSKKPALAKKLPEDFPDIDILLSYTNPITSETEGKPGRNQNMVDWDREPDLGKVAGLCELYFEWGVKDIIIKRFRTVLWPSVVLRILRRAAIDLDKKKQKSVTVPTTPEMKKKNGIQRVTTVGTPSKMITKYFASLKLDTPKSVDASDSDDDDEDENPLIVKIHSSRAHASTDGILEYRLEVAPAQLVRLSEAGVKGIRPPIEADDVYEDSESDGDEDDDDDDSSKRKAKTKKPPPFPDSHIRIWMPACMVRMVEPHLTKAFDEIQERKLAKKLGKSSAAPRKKAGGKKKNDAPVLEESESSSSKAPPKVKKVTKGRKVAQNNEEYEWIDLDCGEDPAEGRKATVKDFYATTKPATKTKQPLSASKDTNNNINAPSASSSSLMKSAPKKPPSKTQRLEYDPPPTVVINSRKSRLKDILLSSESEDNPSDHELPVIRPQRLAPRPFPMPFAMEPGSKARRKGLEDPFVESSSSPSNPSPLPDSQPQPQRRRKKSLSPTESETYSSHITKSPKKSPKHVSPRSQSIGGEITGDNFEKLTTLRNGSPKPTKTLAMSLDVIEISSDSDSSPLRPAKVLAPLLAARAKARTTVDTASQQASKHVPSRPKSSSIQPTSNCSIPISDADIIDLT